METYLRGSGRGLCKTRGLIEKVAVLFMAIVLTALLLFEGDSVGVRLKESTAEAGKGSVAMKDLFAVGEAAETLRQEVSERQYDRIKTDAYPVQESLPVKADAEETAAVQAEMTEVLSEVPGAGTAAAPETYAEEAAVPSVPAADTGERVFVIPVVPEISTGDAEDIPGTGTKGGEVLPMIPGTNIVEGDVPQEGDAPKGDTAGSAFMIDSEGMLCGVSEENLEIIDGCIELPSEGCIGIRSGAFAGVSAEIIEMFIPANISRIEEGAFVGLGMLEWIETEEGNPGCAASEGVLYDSTQTVLLAFPAGRTGGWQVPAVERIASKAFAGTSLRILDMWYCNGAELGEDLFGENVPDTLTLVLPEENADAYRQALSGYGINLK